MNLQKKYVIIAIVTRHKNAIASKHFYLCYNIVKQCLYECKVETDDTFANALLGGLLDAAKELGNAFNNDDK